MQPSPLQLLRQHVDSVHVDAVAEFDSAGRAPGFVTDPGSMRLSSDTAIDEIESGDGWADYRIRLVLSFSARSEGALPYEGRIALEGLVRMHGGSNPIERKQLAAVNGISLLYGSVRELVAQLTSRGRHGEMLLPTLNFRQLAVSLVAQERLSGSARALKRQRKGADDSAEGA